MKKRILSLLLALTMIVGMLPLSVLTATAASAKHYEVDNWGELRQVLEWDSGSTPVTITLTADIYEETPNDDPQKDEGDETYEPIPTVQIVGNKTLDLNGYRIEVNDKSNYRAFFIVGWHGIGDASENTLFNVTADASLTINDATGKGNITFTGHMASEWAEYNGYCVRDIFSVEGTLTLNGGTIEAGRSKKQWFTNKPLDPTWVFYYWSSDSFDFRGYEDTHTGYAYQQIWGTAVTMKGKGTFIMNGGTLYGRGYGQYLDDEKIREDKFTMNDFTTIRDEVILFDYPTAKVYINNGNVYAKGGANLFGGNWLSGNLVIKYGIFETDTMDYIRSHEIYPMRDGFGTASNGELITTGTPGVMNVYEADWKKDLDNVVVTVNGTAYTTLEEKQALDLHDVSGTVILAPVAEDGFALEFNAQNPTMPVGYDNWSLWQEYGKTTTFTFNHIPLTAQQVKDGYYVERNYVIRNVAFKTEVVSESGILGTGIVNVTHTWNEVGTFTFIEDLTLKDKTGATVKSKANTFHIFVQPAVDHIEITTPPTQNTYISNIYKSGSYSLPGFYGEGMVVTAYYTDGTTEDVTKYVDFNRSLAIDATQNAISYTDPVFKEDHFAFQPVTVEKAYQISSGANGGAAYAGEQMYYATEGTQLDLFNTKHYDTTRYQLDGWTVTRDDNGEAVEVHEHINGGAYYFIMPDATVTINPIWTLKKVVKFIQIQTPPTKTDYYEGQNFDPAGMVLSVFYTDGTWEEIKGEALKQYLYLDGTNRYLKPTDTAILVRYNGFEVSQPITVSRSQNIYSIELTMDGYGYGKNVADFTLSLDTDHIRFTEAGNITDGFDLDRWNGSTSATVTSGTFGIFEYDLSIAIQLDAGYIKQFTADTVTVNGIKARSIKSMGSGKYIIGFALPNFIVSEVNLTVADPTPGTTPNDFKVVIPGGSYYTFAGTTQWTAWDEKTQTGWTLSSNGQFEAGVEYSTTLTLKPVDGFVFEDTWYELSATINGEAATITRNSNGTVSVNYSVVIPENPTSTLISNITSYVDEYVNLTVELYKSGETTPAYTGMVRGTTDNPALVVISGIEAGTYTMKVDKPYHKPYTTTITATGNTIYADVELEAISFLAVFHFGSDPIAWEVVDKGEKVIKPEDPAQEGKIFTGWYTADGQLYNFNTPVTDNVNLYARFDYEIDIVESLTVNCIGDIDYTVSGNVVIVTHDKPCKLGYANADGKYVTLTAIKNSDGSYAFTAPTDVTEVILAVKGDISADGRINMGDVSKLYAHNKGTNMITGDMLFAADVSGDGRVNMGDVSKLYAHNKGTNLLTWDT